MEAAYGQLPLSFEQNAGQFEPGVSFAARGDGYGISLRPTEVVLHLRQHSRAEPVSPAAAERSASRPAFERISVRLHGANPAPRVKGAERLAGVSNYFVGRDPAAWRTNVPNFARVEYASVYPGVDLVYYGNGRQLEYDFVVAPGADARRIALEFDGAEGLRLDGNGDLVLRTGGGGELRQLKPVSYQVIDGERREVESRYALAGGRQAVFELGEYDPNHSLVIDPVLSYSTYLGGTGLDEANAVARGADGSIYVTGETGSANFATAGSAQASLAGLTDAFVLKLNAAGTALVYATYVGGAAGEEATAVAVDADGNAYVCGSTQSANFPVTAGALQQTRGGADDAFALKLNPAGTSLAYSTYLGGPSFDFARGVAVDASGRAHVGGFSHSARFINGTPMQKGGSPVYKTTDAAATWQPSENGLDDSTATSFAIHPTDSNIVYAGTNIGVYKTTDGGATWRLTASTPAGDPSLITALALDPSNPSTLYVATLINGVFKSTDGGASYAHSSLGLSTPVIHTLVVDPLTPTTLYVGTEFEGVSKSTNAGASWTPVNNGLGTGFRQPRVARLAIDPTNPLVIYAATRDGLFKTTNGGANWALSSNGMTFPSGSLVPVNTVLVDPTAPSVLYAGTDFGGAFKSTDAGANWTPINNGLQIQTPFGPLTFTVVSLAINPANPSVLYAATTTGFGLFKTTDAGATWTAAGAGITNRVPYPNALELDRANPSTLYAGFVSGSDGFAVRLNAAGTAADYSVFVGGSDHDIAADIALDAAGNAYLTGTTASLNFPVVSPLQGAPGGGFDAFVTKLGPAGAALYSTYLGGNSTEEGRGIAVDASGRAHVTGLTRSTNFPTAGPRQTAIKSFGPDLFVSRFDTAGSALEYSVFHGGAGADEPHAIALDPAGNAYVTGTTASNDFPAVDPLQASGAGNEDAFVLKLGAASEVLYSTYLGGSFSDRGHGVVADAAGAAYVVGRTSSSNFPVVSPLKATYSGGTDAFVAKITSSVRKFEIGSSHVVNEGDGRVTVTVTLTGDATAAATVDYSTADADTFTVGCADAAGAAGNAFARCDFATAVGTLSFAAGETSKTITIPVIDDGHDENSETFQLRLANATGGALGDTAVATVTIIDNDNAGAVNPVIGPPFSFFVRQQYLDFLSREPDQGGFDAWLGVLNGCQPSAHTGPEVQSGCDRIFVSGEGFFRSVEFSLKGAYVFRFYKVAFNRLPEYAEIISDMSFVAGATQQEVFARRAELAARFTQRQEFQAAYAALTNEQYVAALLARYNLQQVTTPDPANPDTGQKVTLTSAQLTSMLNAGTLTRAQVLRAVADSDEVGAREFNNTFVAMQYYGYLRRKPEPTGYEAWLRVLESGDVRAMVNGFLNSQEYRLRFGQP